MIEELLKHHRYIIVGGSGGVGKTSITAALGMLAARKGYRTLVLTIDPARRLAGALGLKEFPLEAREIQDLLRQNQVEVAGTVAVMMLKVEDAFRPLIERVVTDPELKRRIYENPLYREVTRSLSGTPEYAALKRLAELAIENRYDRFILDTPPTTHALHFLNAPLRLHRFFSSGWVRTFATLGGTGFLKRSTNLLLTFMERLTGSHLVGAIGDFLNLTQELFLPLQAEVARAEALLTDPQTTFLVVTAPLPDELKETQELLGSLKALRIKVGGVIVNQILPPLSTPLREPPDAPTSFGVYTPPSRSESKKGGGLPPFESMISSWLHSLRERTHNEVKKARAFLKGWEEGVVFIPKQREDIHTLTGIVRLEQALLNPLGAKEQV